jgi:hypothetical protein
MPARFKKAEEDDLKNVIFVSFGSLHSRGMPPTSGCALKEWEGFYDEGA